MRPPYPARNIGSALPVKQGKVVHREYDHRDSSLVKKCPVTRLRDRHGQPVRLPLRGWAERPAKYWE